uniref:Uncharacterized protein n=1 Tax=Oryza meridionalis TaxID=40149 RepID=A0A0E0D2E8_9ORYZ
MKSNKKHGMTQASRPQQKAKKKKDTSNSPIATRVRTTGRVRTSTVQLNTDFVYPGTLRKNKRQLQPSQHFPTITDTNIVHLERKYLEEAQAHRKRIYDENVHHRSSCGLFMLKCMENWNGSKLTRKFKQGDIDIFRRKLAAILVGSISNENTEIPGSAIKYQIEPEIPLAHAGHLPSYDAFALGGPHSVRGYGMGEFGASRNLLEVAIELSLSITVKNKHMQDAIIFIQSFWT